MAIYTPRGLKIRLSTDLAFALMARLYPKVNAFKVLKTTEGLQSIPGMFAFVAGLICFYLKLDPYYIGIYTLIASIVGTIITTYGLYVVFGGLRDHLRYLYFHFSTHGLFAILSGLPKLGTLYGYISGFGVLLIILAVYGFVSVGWPGVVAFFVGRLVGLIIQLALEFWHEKRIYSKVGEPLTMSEIHFLNAYCLHAAELGKSMDIRVSDEELKEENWRKCFMNLALEWPKVVERFTPEC